jgi:hypothetical protein
MYMLQWYLSNAVNCHLRLSELKIYKANDFCGTSFVHLLMGPTLPSLKSTIHYSSPQAKRGGNCGWAVGTTGANCTSAFNHRLNILPHVSRCAFAIVQCTSASLMSYDMDCAYADTNKMGDIWITNLWQKFWEMRHLVQYLICHSYCDGYCGIGY